METEQWTEEVWVLQKKKRRNLMKVEMVVNEEEYSLEGLARLVEMVV